MGKGGGGGDGGAAEAQRAENARRARIADNIKAVKQQFYGQPSARDVPEAIIGNRMVRKWEEAYDGGGEYVNQNQQYTVNQADIDSANAFNANRGFTNAPTQARMSAFENVENRVRDRFLPDFEQDIGDAQRELKFALSRRGQLGGSGQLDAEERLQDRIGEGRRVIDQRVASARSGKEALDQQLMNSLIGQAQSDVSRSSLLGGVGSSFLSNTNSAINAANQQSMGNMFQDVGSLFKEINDQKAIQHGMANAAMFSGAMRNNPTNLFGGSSTDQYSGTVTDS
jgi:hypothetical protein